MGVKITDTVTPALDALGQRLARPQPLMQQVGDGAVDTAQARIQRGGPAPDGSAWAQRKDGRKNGVLFLSGALSRSLRSVGANNESVAVTSALPYAAYQHAGGKTRPHVIKPKNGVLRFGAGGGIRFAAKVNHPGSTNPAREFVGFGRAEETQLEGDIVRYLNLQKK
jgi:phage gpG-like protein